MVDSTISTSDLKRRGWTLALIRRYLNKPDGKAPNPHYASSPPMLLYDMDRVLAAEATPEFQSDLAKSQVRGLVSKSSGQISQSKLAAEVDAIEVKIEFDPVDLLIRLAIAEYNVDLEPWQWDHGYGVSLESEQSRIDKIVVDFLRREYAISNGYSDRMISRTGAVAARRALHLKTLEAIAATYPFLKNECLRQILEIDTKAQHVRF